MIVVIFFILLSFVFFCSLFGLRRSLLSFSINMEFVGSESFRTDEAPTENLREAAVEVGLGMKLFQCERTTHFTSAAI